MKFGVFKLKGGYIAFIVASFSFRVGLVYREPGDKVLWLVSWEIWS